MLGKRKLPSVSWNFVWSLKILSITTDLILKCNVVMDGGSHVCSCVVLTEGLLLMSLYYL